MLCELPRASPKQLKLPMSNLGSSIHLGARPEATGYGDMICIHHYPSTIDELNMIEPQRLCHPEFFGKAMADAKRKAALERMRAARVQLRVDQQRPDWNSGDDLYDLLSSQCNVH